MFIDASVLVAVLANEPERADFLKAITSSETRVTSVVSIFETSLSIGRLTGSAASALSEVMRFVEASDIEIRGVQPSILVELCIAHDRFGKGTGHPAKLNMGDCFSYALAKLAGMPLLYKGNDFAQTDLA